MQTQSPKLLRMATFHQTVRMSIVIPVFNEADAISGFLDRVNETFRLVNDVALEFVFVNDGSRDSTLETLLDLQKTDPRITVVDFSRNFGKEAALTAGIEKATGEVVVPIDVDLQDPPDIILEMLSKWREGYEVVLGRRCNRDSDTATKRLSARWFYRLHNAIADTPIPDNVGDFRLMDRSVVEALKQLPESRRFMKGLLAWLGFRTATVEYVRKNRSSGTTKFNGWRLWNLAIESFTGFSIAPLRIWCYLGGLVSAISILYACFITLRVLIFGIDLPGYASLMVAITFLGGLQLTGIGVLGEYLGRTYLEAKRRPVYLVRKLYEPTEKVWTSKKPKYLANQSAITGTIVQKRAQ